MAKGQIKFNYKRIEKGELGYPALLAKSIYSVPEIWFAGEDSFEDDEFVLAMVGTRTPSGLAADSIKAMINSLSQNKVRIVSGLAQGVDSLCHSAALSCRLKTTAILGQGLGVDLSGSQRILAEKILESGGSLISQFPPETTPVNWTFVKRNKIISGISNATLLVESRLKGGAMHTANFCIKEGKKLYAAPSSPLYEVSQGCNKMIYDGLAVPVWNFADMPNILGLPQGLFAMPNVKGGYTAKKEKKMEILTIDEICERKGKTRGEILSILTEMEMQGLCAVQNGENVIFNGERL